MFVSNIKENRFPYIENTYSSISEASNVVHRSTMHNAWRRWVVEVLKRGCLFGQVSIQSFSLISLIKLSCYKSAIESSFVGELVHRFGPCPTWRMLGLKQHVLEPRIFFLGHNLGFYLRPPRRTFLKREAGLLAIQSHSNSHLTKFFEVLLQFTAHLDHEGLAANKFLMYALAILSWERGEGYGTYSGELNAASTSKSIWYTGMLVHTVVKCVWGAAQWHMVARMGVRENSRIFERLPLNKIIRTHFVGYCLINFLAWLNTFAMVGCRNILQGVSFEEQQWSTWWGIPDLSIVLVPIEWTLT